MISLLIVPSRKQPRHVNDGCVEDVEDELRIDADGEHQERDGNDDELLAPNEIGETATTFDKWTAEKRLHRAHESHGREKKTQHGDRCKRSSNCKRAFENKKFANESVEPRQTERREHGNTHQAAKQRCPLHQSAEVADATQAAT